MGVHGLWKLIDSAGKPIPVETLENKVLAVDVSIWLYQLVRGFQDSTTGGANSFLVGLFHRICKLLFYRIKPIFVFDGGVPSLKRNTIAERQRTRKKARDATDALRQKLLENLIRQQALGDVLGERVQIPKMLTQKKEEMFWLPPQPETASLSDEEIDDSVDDYIRHSYGDVNSIDVNSKEFLALPPDMRHDILCELKETRKLNSWAKVHLMPQDSGDFSSYQMNRLLKRRSVQVMLDRTADELGARSLTLNDIKNILSDQGVDFSQRIAADNTTRFVYQSVFDPVKETSEPEHRDENTVESEDSESDDDAMHIVRQMVKNESLSQNEILNIIKEQTNDSAKFNDEPRPSRSRDCENLERMAENNCLEEMDHESLPEKSERSESLPDKMPEDASKEESDDGIEPSDDSEMEMVENEIETEENAALSSIESDKGKIGIEISIDPNEPVEDDLFADIFSQPTSTAEPILPTKVKDASKPTETHSPSEPPKDDHITNISNKPQQSIEITIKPDEPIEDDLFADIFSQPTSTAEPILPTKVKDANKPTETHSPSEPPKDDHITNMSNKPQQSIEISIKPDEPFEDDLFADVFANEPETSAQHSKTSSDVQTKKLTEKELIKLKREAERESEAMMVKAKREDKIATTITEQITTEAQELLQLFGIPYIVAPMEAEAQCAYLDLTGQTEGTITDDSDIWLFGGNNVYKNFFDSKKFVKQFKATDILNCYQLTREDLIMIALLVGSDYTTGLNGVGPVNAIEIVAHFPTKPGLSSPDVRLRAFFDAYQSSKLSRGLARKLKSLEFTPGFPRRDVVNAYLFPCVDENRDQFTWSEPDVNQILRFAQHKFGWDPKQTNKTLDPVLAKLKQSTTQKTLHNYFDWAFDDLGEVKSKRVTNAVDILKSGVVPGPSKEKSKRPGPVGTSKSTSKRESTSGEDRARNLGSSNWRLKKRIAASRGKKDQIEIPKRSPVAVPQSKTPAQLAREKAAKKMKEIREREKLMKKSGKSKEK